MKKRMEIFFIQIRQNIWPQIDNRLRVVLALDKNNSFTFKETITNFPADLLDFPRGLPKKSLKKVASLRAQGALWAH